MERTVAGLTVSPGRLVRGVVRRSLRHGRTFRRMLAEMEARERWSVNQLRAYQEERLRELLVTCARHVPYYVDLFRREGLDPERLAPWELMARIPPLEKSEVRRDPERFRNRAMHRRLLHKAYTGGTTGTPLICWRDLRRDQLRERDDLAPAALGGFWIRRPAGDAARRSAGADVAHVAAVLAV